MKKLLSISAWFLGVFLLGGCIAHADESGDRVDEEIIVTGSYVKGTPIDTASPVTSLTSEELERQGSPTIVEMIQKLEFVAGRGYGQTNQFQNNAGEGIASINLRGLGANRTLVLINGQRQVASPFRRGFVDVNQIPDLALERVEILKEGASATYGSDAIAGVFNFITDKDFEGLEFSFSHQDVDGSKSGERQYGFKLGFAAGDSSHVVISAGHHHRSILSTTKRNWATLPYIGGDVGGWSSIGNPGVLFSAAGLQGALDSGHPSGPFVALAGAFGGIKDPQCAALGGADQSLFCRFNYLRFDNIVDEEERINTLIEVTSELGNGSTLNVSLMHSMTDVPIWYTSPSYPPQELFGAVQFVPADHPGLLSMHQLYPDAGYDAYADTDGIGTGTDEGTGGFFYGRVNGNAGYAPTGGGPRIVSRDYQTLRFSASLTGQFGNGMDYVASVTTAEQEGTLEGIDEWISRAALAFRGYGGPNCGATISNIETSGSVNIGGLFVTANGQEAGTGGCLYYNPFSNSIQRSSTNGAVNPDYTDLTDQGVDNGTLAPWIESIRYSVNTTELSVAEFVVSQETGVSLGGGNLAWAAGAQFRSFSETLKNSRVNDLDASPCPYSFNGVEYVEAACQGGTGPTSFLAGSQNYSVTQDVTAVFGELALPLSDNLDIQVAVRYEDYGTVGNTIDPKVSLRYTPTDWLTIRSSVSSTFRGPTAYESSNARFTALQFIGPTGAFKAVDTLGNPLIEPESAQTYSAGLVFQSDRFEMTVDIWAVDMDNPIDIEAFGQIVTRYGDARTDAISAATEAATEAATPVGVDAGQAAALAEDSTLVFDDAFDLSAQSQAVQDAYNNAYDAAYDATYNPAYDTAFLANFTTVTAGQIICAGLSGADPMKASDLGSNPCSPSTLTRVEVSYVNGPATLVEGSDLSWRFFTPGGFELGMSGSYVSRHNRDAYVKGTEQIAPAINLVGDFNEGILNPIPRWRGKLWVQHQWTGESGRDSQFRLAANHIDSYKYENNPSVSLGDAAAELAWLGSEFIDAQTTYDLVYNTTFGSEQQGRFSVNIFNLTDEDPPAAPTNLGYDAFTHNPLGRTVKLGFRYRTEL